MVNHESSGPTGQGDVVPFIDLKPHIALIRDEIHEALDQVLDSCGFANGPAVARFEEEFAQFCGASDCVAVNSGTSALHLAMQCLDVGPGDEVITVSMSFIATAWPILYLGAKPVFVDIDRDRYTLDPRLLESVITPRTKAIVPVHLYGQCADMDPILEIANSHGIPVIEDCAQSHGAEYKGRRAGTMGAVGCFSFYPSKNLGAYGEGGGLTTSNPAIADHARRLRDHGQDNRYSHMELGYNYRMDGFQGAVLSVKLKYLESWTEKRRALAAEYARLLAQCRVTAPKTYPDTKHAHHLYVIRDTNREALQVELHNRNVMTAVHYPTPIHFQKPFEVAGDKPGDLPVTEEVASTCLSLPMYPELSREQVQQVVDAIRATGR